jgi:hypothetical protein
MLMLFPNQIELDLLSHFKFLLLIAYKIQAAKKRCALCKKGRTDYVLSEQIYNKISQ